jgi:hypothetical protein
VISAADVVSEAAAAKRAEEEGADADDDDTLRDHEGNIYFPLSAKKRVTVSTFKKMTLGVCRGCNKATFSGPNYGVAAPAAVPASNGIPLRCRRAFVSPPNATCHAPYQTLHTPLRSVRIGEVYEKDGEMRPGKGISLTVRCVATFSAFSSETHSLTALPRIHLDFRLSNGNRSSRTWTP